MKSFLKKATPYIYIFPSICFLIVFYYLAIFLAFKNSFFDSKSGFESTFIGFDNYVKIFSDKIFLVSFKNQIIFTLTAIIANVMFPLLAAELLHFIRRKRISELIKRIFVIPMLVPGIVTILIWKFLYGNNYGFNNILQSFGLENLQHNWLNDGATAVGSIVMVGFPFVSGLFFLILHSAINTIPKEHYESAVLDGCNTLKVFRYIHLPHLKPFISMIITLVIIGSFQNFGQIKAMTNGGPGYDSMIPSLYMYNVAFGNSDLGYGSALGVFILLVIVALTLISRRITKSDEEEN